MFCYSTDVEECGYLSVGYLRHIVCILAFMFSVQTIFPVLLLVIFYHSFCFVIFIS